MFEKAFIFENFELGLMVISILVSIFLGILLLNNMKYDVIVVGGGLIGLSTSYSLINENPKIRLKRVIMKEKEMCLHQSKRNSWSNSLWFILQSRF